MKIIQLDVVDSTNSFLKELARNTVLENFTTVTAKHQQKGRGQQNGTWFSEKGKNLTFSTYVAFSDFDIQNHRYLNFAVSLAIFDALTILNVPNLSIKWPNDIFVGNYKIGGVLVENTFKNKKIENTIIGIGLNIHQDTFSEVHKKVTSLKISMQKEFDLNEILHLLIANLKKQLALLNQKQFLVLEDRYLSVLYKKNVPATFVDHTNVLFMGIIKGVSSEGKLQIQLEDDTLKEFGIKEVSFA